MDPERLHRMVQEARAQGFSDDQINEVLGQFIGAGEGRFSDVQSLQDFIVARRRTQAAPTREEARIEEGTLSRAGIATRFLQAATLNAGDNLFIRDPGRREAFNRTLRRQAEDNPGRAGLADAAGTLLPAVTGLGSVGLLGRGANLLSVIPGAGRVAAFLGAPGRPIRRLAAQAVGGVGVGGTEGSIRGFFTPEGRDVTLEDRLDRASREGLVGAGFGVAGAMIAPIDSSLRAVARGAAARSRALRQGLEEAIPGDFSDEGVLRALRAGDEAAAARPAQEAADARRLAELQGAADESGEALRVAQREAADRAATTAPELAAGLTEDLQQVGGTAAQRQVQERFVRRQLEQRIQRAAGSVGQSLDAAGNVQQARRIHQRATEALEQFSREIAERGGAQTAEEAAAVAMNAGRRFGPGASPVDVQRALDGFQTPLQREMFNLGRANTLMNQFLLKDGGKGLVRQFLDTGGDAAGALRTMFPSDEAFEQFVGVVRSEASDAAVRRAWAQFGGALGFSIGGVAGATFLRGLGQGG